MIVTSLSYCKECASLHNLFFRAFEYLQETDFSTMKLGKYEIQGDQLFAIISEYQGKKAEDAAPESHKTYIDIQFVLEGEERILWMPFDEAKEVDIDYDETADIMFFKDTPKCEIALQPNQMAILFPNDIHAPAISEGRVRKVILKVRVQ